MSSQSMLSPVAPVDGASSAEITKLRLKLNDCESQVRAADALAKEWEKRALAAESAMTDLKLEITHNSVLFEDAERRAVQSETHSRELLGRLQELQEQCIRLKVANDHHRMNVDMERSRYAPPRGDSGAFARDSTPDMRDIPNERHEPCVRSCG